MFARRLLIASLVCGVLIAAVLPGIAAAEPPNFAEAITKASDPLISAVIGDFIGDANLDVAATTSVSDGEVLLFEGSAAGLENPERMETNATGVGDDMHLASGDFNGDESADLAMSHAGGIDVFRQTADAFSSNSVTLAGAKGVEVADVDGDGNDDLVAATPAATMVLTGKGDGSFDAPSLVGVGGQDDLEVGDFVGDSRLDIAGSSGSTVTVYEQTDTGFQTETRSLPAAVSSLEIGNFGGDAGNDLAVASGSGTGQVHVFIQEADGDLANSATPTPSGNSPQGLVGGDVNGDGPADLVVAHGGAGKVGVYVQDETAMGSESLFNVPTTPSYGPGAVAIGNVVGDSKADIVVAGDGELAVLPGIAPVTPSPSPSPTETPDPEELTQSIPYSVWTQSSGSPLDGMGSWLAVAEDSVAGEGQLDPQYAHSEIFWSETRETVGLVSLVVNGDDKVATFAVIDGTGDPEVIGIPYEWVEGGFYLPLVHRLGDGTWGAWIFDWADRDQGDEAWTFIGQLDAPAQNRISSISATLSFWYGEAASDCSQYPVASVLRYPTLGLAGGQGSIATLAGHDATEGDCDSQVSTPEELDVWDLYQLGAEEADTE